MNKEDLLSALKNDVHTLVQTVAEKYYRGRFPYNMDAVAFRTHALHLIKAAVERMLDEDEFLKNNLPDN